MLGRSRWWIVLASALGLMVGNGAIGTFGMGVFLKPVAEALNVSRGTLSGGVSLALLLNAVLTPLFGLAVDRFGYRRALIVAIPFYALGLSALSILPPSVAGIYLLFGLMGALSVGQTPTAYSKAIATWFDRDRGLALGLGMAGVGIGTAVVPHYAGFAINAFGWRPAFFALALAVLVFALVPVLLFLREPASDTGGRSDLDLEGVTVREAVRSVRFWAILSAFLCAAVAINGTLAHVVALLTDRGLSVAQATSALSSAGLAIIAGRLAAGYALDRIFAPYVAAFFFVCPLLGIVLLDGGWSGLAGVVLCGLAVGADIDLIPFLAGRYFGMRSFGRLYSIFFGVFTFGTALGPALMGLSYDRAGSYRPSFLVFEALLIAGVLMLIRLGPYGFGPGQRGSDAGPRSANPG